MRTEEAEGGAPGVEESKNPLKRRRERPAGQPKPEKNRPNRARRKELKAQERTDREAGVATGRFRHRILPRTVIGIVTMLLAGAIGFAFGGTILYAYYQSRLDKVSEEVQDYIARFEGRYDNAIDDIRKEAETAKGEVRREIEPLQELRASGQTLKGLIDKTADSVYLVQTQNEFGEPQVGSAFVLTSDAEKSYLVTSLSVVKAATQRPGPVITLRRGEETVPATLHTWHEERDLALLIVNKGSLPRLKWVSSGANLDLGQRVFVIGGVGGAGGSITQGFIADVSNAGVQHDAAVTGPFAGGPLLNSKGEVVGVGTPEYRPLGFTSDRVTFSSPIRAACEKILKCPEGGESAGGGAGPRR
jgi:hypothetical protein